MSYVKHERTHDMFGAHTLPHGTGGTVVSWRSQLLSKEI